MSSENSSKIINLLGSWPQGTAAIPAWLKKQGISQQLTDRYCKSGWLHRLDKGVYIQHNDQIDWTGGLYTIQHQLHLNAHIAAQSALEFVGLGHYLPLNKETPQWIFIDNLEPKKIPTWYKRHFAQVQFIKTKLFADASQLAITSHEVGNYSVLISTPERAILECLHLTPHDVSLEYSMTLMEKLITLRPSLVQQLLKQCTSIKVKRLFLYLAETLKMPWYPKLILDDINLGRGVRTIGTGGHYIAKYQLIVPTIIQHEGYPEDDNPF